MAQHQHRTSFMKTRRLPRLIMVCVATAVVPTLLNAADVAPALPGQPATPQSWTHPSPDEPFAKALSITKAAESLDRVSLAWTQKQKCGSCHTTFPYMMSRAVLKGTPSTAMTEVRAFFENRIRTLETDREKNPHFTREVMGTAAVLAVHDSQTTGKLHPLTRQALDRTWTLQREDGAWDWPKCRWVPFEMDDYYGALMVAVGVGHAPEGYARAGSARAGLEKLRAYFKATPSPSLHHKAWLLWAATKLDGLMSVEEKQTTLKELLALQRGDGGWSMESLGKDWVGRKGEKSNPDAPSDGYGTGLVVHVMREAGVPAGDAAIQRGAHWLRTHQRESGRWFTRSLNGVEQHYISHTATAFAVLALKACE